MKTLNISLLKGMLLIVFSMIITNGISQQINYTISLKDNNGQAFNPTLAPIKIIVVGQTNSKLTVTAVSTGILIFPAYVGDIFKILNAVDDTVLEEYVLTNTASKDIVINKNIANAKFIVETKAAASSKNYWLGASVAYNLDGDGSDDIVGGTKLKINPFEGEGKSVRASFSVIGNVGTFFSNTDKAENEKAISKLAQSQTGLGVGLGYIFELAKKSVTKEKLAARKFGHRIELTTGYRLNSFKDPKADTASIGLSQWRSAFLHELFLKGFKNEGEITLSSEVSYSLFSAEKYKEIFGNSQKSRVTFEATLIVPVSKKIGFMVNLISTKDIKPVYQFGFIIKPEDE